MIEIHPKWWRLFFEIYKPSLYHLEEQWEFTNLTWLVHVGPFWEDLAAFSGQTCRSFCRGIHWHTWCGTKRLFIHRLYTCFMRQCWKYVFGDFWIVSRFILLADHMQLICPNQGHFIEKKQLIRFMFWNFPSIFEKKKTANNKQLHPNPFGLLGVPQILPKKNARPGSLTTGFFGGSFVTHHLGAISWLARHSGPGAEGPNDISGLYFSSRLGQGPRQANHLRGNFTADGCRAVFFSEKGTAWFLYRNGIFLFFWVGIEKKLQRKLKRRAYRPGKRLEFLRGK